MERIINFEIKNGKIIATGEPEEKSFKEYNMHENELEEFVSENIDLFIPENRSETNGSMMIVGRQAIDSKGKRSDLLAIDNTGSLVIIEIKRDKDDIKNRQEPLELQVIRYAASVRTIREPAELVDDCYARYVSKYLKSEIPPSMNATEYATKRLNDFLTQNHCEDAFNKKQRIMIVGSDFDGITVSALSWLILNNVDISLIRCFPTKDKNNTLHLRIQHLLPTEDEEDNLIKMSQQKAFESGTKNTGKKYYTIKTASGSAYTYLPRMDKLIEWGIVTPNVTEFYIRGHKDDSRCKLYDAKTVKFKGKRMSFLEYGKKVTGWSSIQPYFYMMIVGDDSESLSEKRMNYLIANNLI